MRGNATPGASTLGFDRNTDLERAAHHTPTVNHTPRDPHRLSVQMGQKNFDRLPNM